ncbi:ClpX, ATPase regulatory subunit [Dipodascopsis tothii]|uniref:ClpX, ATPase regulatory subunit n=1 Tax=Dipodascopsis tothii TaxID=44089 RepID=UPI0034CF049A
MMLGPTGTGKTLLMRTIAKLLEVPLAITDCTPLTQAGYVGEDADSCIQRLLVNADYDVARAEMGIVVLDECDKIARQTSPHHGRDVSGEGVQQALLQIIEGTTLNIQAKADRARTYGGSNSSGASAGGKETFTIDTSNILFILSGAFVGLDKVIRNRVSKNSMGFNAIIREDEEEQLAQSPRATTNELEKRSVLEQVETQDLATYGLIPELIGRVPIVCTLSGLTESDLLRVLTEPKNALVRQYEHTFRMFGVELKFTDGALRAIARLAVKQGTGARALKGIMSRLLMNVNFEAPESSTRYVIITEKVVETFQARREADRVLPLYYSRGQSNYFHTDLAKENETEPEEKKRAEDVAGLACRPRRRGGRSPRADSAGRRRAHNRI